MEFTMYKSLINVDAVLQESKEKQILILKHSITCPISYNAKCEVDEFINRNVNSDVYLVIVQENRAVSNELSEKLEIRHESPQFLIVKNMKAEKVLNHYDITLENIDESLTL